MIECVTVRARCQSLPGHRSFAVDLNEIDNNPFSARRQDLPPPEQWATVSMRAQVRVIGRGVSGCRRGGPALGRADLGKLAQDLASSADEIMR